MNQACKRRVWKVLLISLFTMMTGVAITAHTILAYLSPVSGSGSEVMVLFVAGLCGLVGGAIMSGRYIGILLSQR